MQFRDLARHDTAEAPSDEHHRLSRPFEQVDQPALHLAEPILGRAEIVADAPALSRVARLFQLPRHVAHTDRMRAEAWEEHDGALVPGLGDIQRRAEQALHRFRHPAEFAQQQLGARGRNLFRARLARQGPAPGQLRLVLESGLAQSDVFER